MTNTQTVNIIGDALRHKIYREGDFAIISIDVTSDETPNINVSDTYPHGEANAMILSKYALGQWLNQPDSQIKQDVLSMLGQNMAEFGSISHIMCNYQDETLDSDLLSCFNSHTLEESFVKISEGKPFNEAFDVDTLYDDILEQGINNTPFRDVEQSQIKQELTGLLQRLEEATLPDVEEYQQQLPALTASLVEKVKQEAVAFKSLTPPDTQEASYALANDIPEETEILLRTYSQLNQLQGSVFLINDPDGFQMGELSTVEASTNTGGSFTPEKTFMVTNARKDIDYGSHVPPWRSVAIHEITHFVDAMLNQDGTEASLADNIITDDDEIQIRKEVEQNTETAEKIIATETDNLDNNHQEFLDNFSHALFPDGVNGLAVSNTSELRENMLVYANYHFNYLFDLEEDYGVIHHKNEHLARGVEIIHTLATEIQIAENSISRESAVERASNAIAVFSPTLVKAIHGYEQERHNYLEQLRQEQGTLKDHIRYDTLPEGLNVPDPTHANSLGKVKVVSSPPIAEEQEAVTGRVV